MSRFTPLILIIVAIAGGFFYIRPQYTEIQALRQESMQYDDLLLQAQELKSIHAELEEKRKSISADDLDRLSKLVPEKIDTARLILDIDGIGSRYAIGMKNIQIGDIVADEVRPGELPKPYGATAISFAFQTSYEGMVAFVRDLEESLRMVDVVDITLAEGEEDSPFFNYTITLQAYWLNPVSLTVPTQE